MNKIFDLVQNVQLSTLEIVGLAVGLLLGLGLIMLIRARQVWSNRRAFGYDNYTASRLRGWLLGWAAIAVLAGIGVFAMVRWQAAHRTEEPPEVLTVLDEEGEQVEVRLLIPRLAVNTVMIEAPFVGNYWDISRLTHEVAHLAGTSYPGEPGNTVLAGHITVPDAGWGPFKDLEKLQTGDRVFVEHGTRTFVYVVEEARTIQPEDVEIAFPTGDERLTLVTCTGWDGALDNYAERYVVVARKLH